MTEVEGAYAIPDEAEEVDDWMFIDKLSTLGDDDWNRLCEEYGVRRN